MEPRDGCDAREWLMFGTCSRGTWGHGEQAGQEYVIALARRFRQALPAIEST